MQLPLTTPLILQHVVGQVQSQDHVLQQSQVLVMVAGAGDDPHQLAQSAHAVKKRKEKDQSERPQPDRKNVLTGLKL